MRVYSINVSAIFFHYFVSIWKATSDNTWWQYITFVNIDVIMELSFKYIAVALKCINFVHSLGNIYLGNIWDIWNQRKVLGTLKRYFLRTSMKFVTKTYFEKLCLASQLNWQLRIAGDNNLISAIWLLNVISITLNKRTASPRKWRFVFINLLFG